MKPPDRGAFDTVTGDLIIQMESLQSLIETAHLASTSKISIDLAPGLFHLSRLAGEILEDFKDFCEGLIGDIYEKNS